MASTKQISPMSQQWLAGHEGGYRDAIAELWEMSHEAFEARDEARMKMLQEVAAEVRDRMPHVLERQAALLEEQLHD